MSTATITIDTTGTIRFVYRDELAELIDAGKANVLRASHVEPAAGNTWAADLSPVDGPTLGPFAFRGTALAAEVAWLEANRL